MSRVHSYSHSRAHSPTFPSLHLRHSSFSKSSVTSPTSQLIIQPFRHFTYVTAHSPILLSLYLRHSSFSNLLSLHLRHSSFSNTSVASPTSQLILQHFFSFFYALHLYHLSSCPCVFKIARP